jgi:AraC-like DNA-binding protein
MRVVRGTIDDSVAIRSLPFRHNVKPGLGFEIFRLAELVARVPAAELATPQRPEFYGFYFGLRGRGTLRIDFVDMPIAPDTLTVLAHGRVQQFVQTRNADAWMLLVSPEFIELEARTVDPLRGATLLSPLWMQPTVRLAPAERRELHALIEQLEAEHSRPLDSLQPAVLEALLRAVLLRAERIVRASPDGPATLPAEVQRFFTILERDCTRTRSVAHYAKEAGVSTRRLGELLVAHTGRSTKQLIDERVVLEQKRLLAHTDISIKELADRTGFPEPTNLVKFFRHHTRTTPQAFRTNLPSARRS